MDPRLKRWGLVALAGAVLAAIMLLPGGEPIMGLSESWDPWRGLSPLAARQLAVQEAMYSTTYKINGIRQRQVIGAALSDRRDPLVLSSRGDETPLLAAVRRSADSIWSTLPARHGEIRTIIDVSRNGPIEDRGWDRDSSGNCIVQVGLGWDGGTLSDIVRDLGGGCLFREAFGAPGPSWEEWQEQIRWHRIAWTGVRPNSLERRLANDPETRPRAWFEFRGWDFVMSSSGSRLPSASPLQLAYSACRAGRADQCLQAFQVDTGAVLLAGRRDGAWTAPTMKLPAALLTDLGPTKFAELWRTDLPISTAYQKLSGRPIDPILTEVAMRTSGPRLRETSLPLLSWFGVFVWAGLLLLWARERIRTRVVG